MITACVKPPPSHGCACRIVSGLTEFSAARSEGILKGKYLDRLTTNGAVNCLFRKREVANYTDERILA